jgi:hypothetical protein
MHAYLLMWLVGPIFLDTGVTEVTDFLQHSVHEGGAKFRGVCSSKETRTRSHSDYFTATSVIVVTWHTVQEFATSFHVPA